MFERKQGTRRIFDLKVDELVGSWRKLRNEKIDSFYSLSKIIMVIKATMVWSAKYEARIAYIVLVGNLKKLDD
jgi:hypothetical protein